MVQRLGKYEILEELGRGSFGRVYRAFDPSVKRHVAIKVLSADTDPDLLTRFQAEAGTTGSLAHKNIVTVYEFGREGDRPYLVMELLTGVSLEEIIARHKPFSLLEKTEILYQIGEGLQAAHARSVVHRDMKPGNIIVLPDGTVKIMDFGIALVAAADMPRNTQQGGILGTVMYMAPEQFQGAEADAQTDLFAFGVICYEFLTGEHPFGAADPRTSGFRITTHQPPPVREKVPECSEVIESLIQRLMSKDREFRVSKAEEAVLDILPVLLDLRQKQAATLALKIEPLLAADDVQSATAQIDEVLRLDASNPTARGWLTILRRRKHQATVKARVEAILVEATTHFSARRFGDAVHLLENAIGVDRENVPVQTLIEKARKALESSRQASRLVAEARWDERKEAFETAIEKVQRALELDPDNRDAVACLEGLRLGVRRRVATEVLQRAEQHWVSAQYEDALAELQGFPSDLTISSKAETLRQRIEFDKAEHIRRQACFDAAITRAMHLLEEERLDEAQEAAAGICADFPEEPRATEILLSVQEAITNRRREEEIRSIEESVVALRGENKFIEAQGAVDVGLGVYPESTGLLTLREMLAVEREQHERDQAVAEAVRASELLEASGQYDLAIAALDQGLARCPANPTLVDRRSTIENERQRREYAAGLEMVLDDARRLLTDQPDEAASILEGSIYIYPGEPSIHVLLTSARRLAASRREQVLVAEALDSAARSEADGDLHASLAQLEAAELRFPQRSELAAASAHVKELIADREHRRALSEAASAINAAIASRDWEAADSTLKSTQVRFPGELPYVELAARIHEEQVTVRLQALETGVRIDLERADLQRAERRLTESRAEFSGNPIFEGLWAALVIRRDYESALQQAAKAKSGGNEERAAEILRALVDRAPDQRAVQWLAGIAADRRRREAALRAELEAEERAREARKLSIAEARLEVAAFLEKGESSLALVLLDRVCALYPESIELREDRLATARRLELEASDRASAAQAVTISGARSEAEELAARGDIEGAFTLLDVLRREYPSHVGLAQHHTSLAKRVEAARKKSKEEALRATKERTAREAADRAAEAREQRRRLSQRKRSIAAGRRSASDLRKTGNLAAQVALLKRLCLEYPDTAELVGDLAEANHRLAEIVNAGRRQAKALLDTDSLSEAVELLDRLCKQYPSSAELESDRDAALRTLEEAIVLGISDSKRLVEEGEIALALASLEGLCEKFPNRAEVLQARVEATNALSAQRREREELDVRERHLVEIDSGRCRAADLSRAGEYDGALAVLNELALRYPGSQSITEDRNAVSELLERKSREDQARRESEQRASLSRRQEVLEGREAAARLLRQGDHQSAFETLDRLKARYPGESAIEKDLNDARADWESRRLVDQARQDAQELARAQREQAEIDSGCRQAAGMVSEDDYSGALSVLHELAKHFPTSTRVLDDLDAIRKEIARKRRAEVERCQAEESLRRQRVQAEIAAERHEAAHLGQSADWTGAVTILESLAVRYPADSDVAKDLAVALGKQGTQRREAAALALRREAEGIIAKTREEASVLVAMCDLLGAAALLSKLAAKYPDDEGIQEDRASVERAIDEQRLISEARAKKALAAFTSRKRILREEAREHAIAVEKDRASRLGSHGDLAAAVAILDRLVSLNPDDTEIAAQRQDYVSNLARQRKETATRAISEGRQEAVRLQKAGLIQQALDLLARLAAQYPDSPELGADQQSATKSVASKAQERDESARRAMAVLSARRRNPSTRRPEVAPAAPRKIRPIEPTPAPTRTSSSGPADLASEQPSTHKDEGDLPGKVYSKLIKFFGNKG